MQRCQLCPCLEAAALCAWGPEVIVNISVLVIVFDRLFLCWHC